MSSLSAQDIDPSRVHAAVFDLGGVLIEGGPSNVLTFGEQVGLDPATWDRLRRVIFGNEGAWARLERGEVSYACFLDELKRHVVGAGGTINHEQDVSFLGERFPLSNPTRVRTDLVAAVRSLHARMPTALLTNNVREWRAGWQRVLDVENLFDAVIDSSEVGTRKPERRIYEITRERLGVAHEEIFFLDDIGQNLKAARELGWQTLLYEDAQRVLDLLGNFS